LANLNASVTNLIFSPLLPTERNFKPLNVVKPNQAQRQHVFTAQLMDDPSAGSRFNELLNAQGFPRHAIEQALLSFSAHGSDEDVLPVPSDLVASMKASTFQASLDT
jgi:pre-rRNA-processing protein IPI3